MTRSFLRRLAAVLAYFALANVVGVLGYMWIEGWGLHDALYMTVITLTAVGYDEVRPLSAVGRNFTMVLLGAGITGLGLWFALVTAFVVELDLRGTLLRRRTMKGIDNLKGHVIVCGAGRTGRQVANELREAGQSVVLIEVKPERVRAYREEYPDTHIVEGDGTYDNVLESAGIRRARGILTCLDTDADNLLVCLSAGALNRELIVVARANETETAPKMHRAGATHVVSPIVSGAINMASVLLRPSVVAFLEIATRSHDVDLRLEEVSVGPDSGLAGKTLAEARIPEATGLIVIGLMKGARKDEVLFNPVAETVLNRGDDVIVMGRPDQLEKLDRLLK